MAIINNDKLSIKMTANIDFNSIDLSKVKLLVYNKKYENTSTFETNSYSLSSLYISKIEYDDGISDETIYEIGTGYIGELGCDDGDPEDCLKELIEYGEKHKSGFDSIGNHVIKIISSDEYEKRRRRDFKKGLKYVFDGAEAGFKTKEELELLKETSKQDAIKAKKYNTTTIKINTFSSIISIIVGTIINVVTQNIVWSLIVSIFIVLISAYYTYIKYPKT